MSLTHKNLVALRRCCGRDMKTYHLEMSRAIEKEKKILEYECEECGNIRRFSHDNDIPFTLRLIVEK